MRRKILASFSILFLIVFMKVFSSFFFKKRQVDTVFYIQDGASADYVVNMLYEKKLISGTAFPKLYVRLKNVVFKAGNFTIKGVFSDAEILRLLAKCQVRLVRVTIPEGSNIFDIGEILENSGLCEEENFLKLTFDKTFLKKSGIDSTTAEGFLFPDTYLFGKSDSCEKIVKTMYGNFRKKVLPLFKSYVVPSIVKKAIGNVAVDKIIAVASIVEKEAANDEEKPLIAGVIYNRLRKGMFLQCDPTIIYGYKIEGIDKERLLGSDIRKSNSPYNTYKMKNLPPTPICNPGIVSIKAAMYPANTKYFYFLAVNGKHIFSKTYKEHLLKIKKYYNR